MRKRKMKRWRDNEQITFTLIEKSKNVHSDMNTSWKNKKNTIMWQNLIAYNNRHFIDSIHRNIIMIHVRSAVINHLK